MRVVTGYTFQRLATLTVDGGPYTVPPGAAVTLRLKKDGVAISDPVLSLEGHANADWPTGVIVIDFPSSVTDSLTVTDAIGVVLEIAVDTGSTKQPWEYCGIEVTPGVIE